MRITVASFVLLLLGQIASAQITGQIKIEKSYYASGEPVEAVFTAQNTGSKSLEIGLSDPYGQCSPYQVHGIISKESERKRGGAHLSKEFEDVKEIDCLSSSRTFAPQTQYIEKFRLDRGYDLTHPGKYHSEVTRSLTCGKKGTIPNCRWQALMFKNAFDFTVD